MEINNTQKNPNLLGQINFYQKETLQNPVSEENSSQNSSSQNDTKKNEIVKLKEPVVDEKYFHFKLKHLLNVQDDYCFANATIPIDKFLQDLEDYLAKETNKNKELDENVAKQIFQGFKGKLKDESKIEKIEIDSFFVNVTGKKVKDFFLNMKQYSFPAGETPIDENMIYTILIESTHCLKNTLKKKTDQLTKYFLYFSLFYKYLDEYESYLKNFQDIFIGKYFTKPFPEIKTGDFSNYKASFSFTKNFIILIATDHTLKLFEETMNKIEKSNTPVVFQISVKNCFPNIFDKEKKNYQDESLENEAKNYNPSSKIAKYETFNFLLKEINKKDNWIAKVIYFDLYFDLVVPKCVIAEGLEKIDEEIGALKNKNNLLEKRNNLLENTVSQLNKKNDILSQKIDVMLNFFERKFEKNLLSELKQNLKEIEMQNDMKKEQDLEDKINNKNMEEKERNNED